VTRRTPTGREPSKPNMQRIPLRTETVRRIREALGAFTHGRPMPDVHAGELDLARGAAFVAGLPEGTVIEFREIEPPSGFGWAKYRAFTVRRARVVGTVKGGSGVELARVESATVQDCMRELDATAGYASISDPVEGKILAMRELGKWRVL
jgi:hypothetical protein